MGYTRDFEGKFTLDRPLTQDQAEYINTFSLTRRMKRDPLIAQGLPDPIREKVGLPVGIDGEYFVGGLGAYGQDDDDSVLEHNDPSSTQPGLWCQWVPTEDGTAIEWDGNEKFYYYIEWLQYILDNFLIPWGYVLNGSVFWQGERDSDKGWICVKNNLIRTTRDIQDIIE
jgi:hypothetical protein